MRIYIYVQHLLGGGHLSRMKILAAEFARASHEVTLISGGVSENTGGGGGGLSYDFVQLPAVKTLAGDFTKLLTATGETVDDDFKTQRAQKLLQCISGGAPDAIIIETFPFGRRQLRFELLPLMKLIEKLNPRPLMFCSLRDILQSRETSRLRQSVAEARAWFNFILVHADPNVVKLHDSFPLAAELAEMIFYSGYVAEKNGFTGESSGGDGDGDGEIIVSAGGGVVGFDLLQTAIAAKKHSAHKNRRWRILISGHAPESELRALQKNKNISGGGEIIIERNRPDFRALLAKCAVSVSMAGYNTVLDLTATNCRAVLVPFARGGETEQTHRAEIFAKLGRVIHLRENDLTAITLANAVDAAAKLNLSACDAINMNGAVECEKFIRGTLK